MLMALELSGGGNAAAVSPGGMSAPAGSSTAPQGGSAETPAEAQRPQPSVTTVKAQGKKDSPSSVPATKKTESVPIAQAPTRPNPPTKAQPEQTMAPAPETREADWTQAASAIPAEHDGNSGLNFAGTGNGVSETAGPPSGNAGHQHGAGNGSGAPGHGASGTAGAGGGGDATGGAGAGGSLINFGTPGGPGIVRMAQPRYPHEAKRLGKEGVVVLKLTLDAAGAVIDVEVMQSAGFGMDEASREAVMLSRFRPATAKGRPVPCQAILPIHFKLR